MRIYKKYLRKGLSKVFFVDTIRRNIVVVITYTGYKKGDGWDPFLKYFL
jgi:hypothetical protein